MTPETLRIWVRQTEIDTGDREGITSEAKERVRQLERENAELNLDPPTHPGFGVRRWS